MTKILHILGDRGFWTSFAPLATLIGTSVFHVSDANVIKWTAAIQTLCIFVDGYFSRPAPELPPK
jgi:hypothetical protein